MHTKWLSTAALVAALALPAGMAAKAHAAAAPAATGLYQDRPWDQPPEEYHDIQKQGYRDGIASARRDFEHHARHDVDDHEQYRHPPVPGNVRNDYRFGFKHGYEVAMRRMEEEHRQ